MEGNDEDQAALEAITSSPYSAAGSPKIPFHPIQLRIRAFSNQFGEYKNPSPRLLVLVDAPGQGGLSDFTVLSAMYGIAPIGGPIQQDDKDDYSDPSFGFGRASRYLTRRSNTALSAVAILEYVSPNWGLRKQALDQQDFGHGSERFPKMTKFLHELREQNPEIFARVPRLRVFRNVFAATPWPAAALIGPHDFLWPSEESR